MLEDTIIAISTPPGQGGIGLIRISGAKALAVATTIFRMAGKLGRTPPVRRAEFGYLRDPETERSLDEGFLTYFKAPSSYTGEDVVELSFHGSPVILNTAVRLGIWAGARGAQPGEFTLRAYLNGRIDIIQAEAVNDLIRAVSPVQAFVSFRQISGSLSKRIAGIRRMVLRLMAQLEAAIEFPEDGLRINRAKHTRALNKLSGELSRLVGSYDTGKALGDNPTLAIIGKPNVGKSTLFNALLSEDRAIVTPYPGTTRDFLRENARIKDAVFLVVDMAGLGAPGHPIEKEGVAKGRRIAAGADGLLLTLDGSRRESGEDERLLRRYAGRKAIIVLNKSDLPRKIDLAKVRSMAGPSPRVEVSALTGNGLEGLREAIHEAFAPPPQTNEEIVLHLRQRDALEEILEAVGKASDLLKEGHPEEIVAEEIRVAIPAIGRLTGDIRASEVMEDIFGRFCVGK